MHVEDKLTINRLIFLEKNPDIKCEIFHPEIMNISFVFPGKMDLDDSINPWLVSSFEEFHFYCCPECDIKTKELGELFDHAVQQHQLAKETLTESEVEAPEIAEESMKIQTEFADSEFAVDYTKHKFAVHFENQNQDKDPLATNINETTRNKRKQIIQTREELESVLQEPNIQEKKLVQKASESQKNLKAVKLMKVEVERYVQDHVQEYHSDSDSEFQPVNKKQKRTQSIRTNEETKVFKCEHCDYESTNPGAFKNHTNSLKICESCLKVFCGKRSVQNLKSHQREHNFKPKKPHICIHCNKPFQYASTLKQHLIRSPCGRKA